MADQLPKSGFYQKNGNKWDKLDLETVNPVDSIVFDDDSASTGNYTPCTTTKPESKSITIKYKFICSPSKLVLSNEPTFKINLDGFTSEEKPVKNYILTLSKTFTGDVTYNRSDYKINGSDIYYNIIRKDPDMNKVYMTIDSLSLPQRGYSYGHSEGKRYDYFPATTVYWEHKTEQGNWVAQTLAWNLSETGSFTNTVALDHTTINLKEGDRIRISQSEDFIPDNEATWNAGELKFYYNLPSDHTADPYPLNFSLDNVYLKSKDCKIKVTCAVWPDSAHYTEDSWFTKDNHEIKAKQEIEMNVGTTYTFKDWYIPVDKDVIEDSIPTSCRWEKIVIYESNETASDDSKNYPHLGKLNIECYFIENACYETHKPKGYVLVSTKRI